MFFVVLAAAMALWIHVRFPNLSPSDLRAGAIRIFIAFVGGQVAVPAAAYLARPLSGAVESGMLLAVGFAAMVFLMLAVVWMLRLAHGLTGGMLR